jgi:anti-sigma factor RsiW
MAEEVAQMPTLNPIRRHRERCREVRAQMSDYLDGELEPRAAAGVERHVRWCPNCRRMLANLRRTVAGLGALGDLPTPADERQG